MSEGSELPVISSVSVFFFFSRADKPHYVIQTPTAAVKNDWCVDFNIAKLALGKVILRRILS